jgi:hypothetical protein
MEARPYGLHRRKRLSRKQVRGHYHRRAEAKHPWVSRKRVVVNLMEVIGRILYGKPFLMAV